MKVLLYLCPRHVILDKDIRSDRKGRLFLSFLSETAQNLKRFPGYEPFFWICVRHMANFDCIHLFFYVYSFYSSHSFLYL